MAPRAAAFRARVGRRAPIEWRGTDRNHLVRQPPGVEAVIGHSQVPSARAVAIASVQGNFLRPKIEACGPEWLERATETVSNALTASFGEGSLTVPNRALLVKAHKGPASRGSC